MKQKNKGITLIALVITIIVLLILAAVSIATLTGENGILTKAGTAKTDTQKASAIEQAKIDILAWQTEQMQNKQSAELSDSKIQKILTGKDYVKGEPGDTSFTSKEGDHIIEYSELYKPSQTTPTVTFNPETFELGTAINSEKYGWKVTGYTKTTPEFTTGVWRLFYQDNNYTYLITDECVGNYKPSDYYKNEDGELIYKTGEDVSIVGRKLNKMLLNKGTFFVEDNVFPNIKATAWLTDISDNAIWKEYKNEDAVFAIGSPTIELYKASFDVTASANKATTFTLNEGTYGYTIETTADQLKTIYNYGIYNKSSADSWWIASPNNRGVSGVPIVAGNIGFFSSYNADWDGTSQAVRPIVCIPTSVFESKYVSTLIAE